jgi:hypothetical protein
VSHIKVLLLDSGEEEVVASNGMVVSIKWLREVKVSMVQPRCVDVVRLGRPLHRWELVGAMVWLMLAHVRP